MPYRPCPCLPDKSNWSFKEIASDDPDRSKALEGAGSPEDLLDNLVSALESGISDDNVRIARQPADNTRGVDRAVVQFQVSVGLFDCFFNARTGYRAHFWAHPAFGLEFNSHVIEILSDILEKKLPDRVSGWRLNKEFEDCKRAEISKKFLITSLVPCLSKIWFCTRLIERDGKIVDAWPWLQGPKICLDQQGKSWPAPYPKDNLAWIDVKGAFLGECPYQPKCPLGRAIRLHVDGNA